MRHRKNYRKLNRAPDHRRAMLRNMVTSLFEHGKITTTDTRAKELRRVAEKLITLGKRNTLHSKRHAARYIQTRHALSRLFDEIAPGFTEREGGYTRIIKVGNRQGDDALVSIIELMPPGAPERKKGTRAPSLKSSASIPVTKERFDTPGDEDAEA